MSVWLLPGGRSARPAGPVRDGEAARRGRRAGELHAQDNRRLIDHCSELLLPYTERGRSHLLAEGIPSARILVVGNPIGEVMAACRPMVDASAVLDRLGLRRGGFVLAIAHRQENVGPRQRLTGSSRRWRRCRGHRSSGRGERPPAYSGPTRSQPAARIRRVDVSWRHSRTDGLHESNDP
ncbi:MAG: UDP-N-acetylglucosamine 2-epimerase [Candidatus Rokuibacteriota bacterium]